MKKSTWARVVVCRTADAANSRFWITSGETGALYTRSVQSFFFDADMTEAMLRRFRAAMDAANFWDRFETDWALLDGEPMPWSAKAQALLPEQYTATAGLGEVVELLEKARRSGLQTDDLFADFMQRKTRADQYVEACRRCCWPLTWLDGCRFAPFHFLASEGHLHMGRNYVW